MADLEFELSIGKKLALQEIVDFRVEAQKELDKLTISPKRSGTSSMLTDDFAEQQMREEKLTALREKTLQKIEQLEQRYGTRLISERRQLESGLTRLATDGSNARITQFEREMNSAISTSNRTLKAQQKATAGAAGKGNMLLFQTQQIVEDFSFAGLRGASNNIAMIASQIGGPAGIAALMGITAVQAFNLADAFTRVSEDSDRLANSTQRLKNQLLAVTAEIQSPTDSFDVSRPIAEAERLSKALDRAAASHRAAVTTLNNRESIAGFLEQYKQANDTLQTRNNFGGADPAVIMQAQQRIADLREQLRTLAPEIDWDAVLGARSYDQINAIIKSIRERTVDGIDSIHKSSQAVQSLTAEWQKAGAASLKAIAGQKQIRNEFDLIDGERFRATARFENSPELAQLQAIRKEMEQFEKLANDAYKIGDFTAFRDAARDANRLADDLQAVKDAQDAVKDAQKEQLDQARDLLREQKELNREKESQVKHEQSILKELENESRQYRVSNAAGDTDTRQGMSNSHIQRMKARDEQLIGMSPNQDWQKLMKSQLDQYYSDWQAASDRFYAKEKNNQLSFNAKSAADMGDHKESRKYLEELQQFQRQQAMNARTPQEAQFWYKKSLETQKQIEESFQKQKAQQQEKIDGIKNEIKSVEELEQRVEELSDKLRNTPKLDMSNPSVIQFLDTVDKKVRDIIDKLQSPIGGGKSGGSGSNPFGGFDWGGNGGNPFAGFGSSGNPFAGVDWSGNPWSGFGGTGDGGVPVGMNGDNPTFAAGGGRDPFGGVDWNSPAFGGASSFGGMTAELSRMPSPFRSVSNSSVSNQTNFSGAVNLQFAGAGFDYNRLVSSARHEQANALLRRGC